MKAVAGRLGHPSTRMVDTIYVQIYEEASEVADAIDEWAPGGRLTDRKQGDLHEGRRGDSSAPGGSKS